MERQYPWKCPIRMCSSPEHEWQKRQDREIAAEEFCQPAYESPFESSREMPFVSAILELIESANPVMSNQVPDDRRRQGNIPIHESVFQ